MAGVTGNPMEFFDLIEIHDAFVISVIQTMEDLGMIPYGHAESRDQESCGLHSMG